MKLALVLALLPLSSLAAWNPSTGAAIKAYTSDYNAERGGNAPSPVGMFLEKEEDEILARVYFEDGSNLQAYDYGCHLHGSHYDCHRENRLNLGAYSRSSRLYSAEEIQRSMPLALAFFREKVAPESTITAIKLWEAEENIRYVFRYSQAGAEKTFNLACHYHGNEMDCHRKRDAGPGEPEKK